MERFLLRPLLSISTLFLVCNFSFAQDLTGIWKGYFITDIGEQYKLEFQIKQDNPSSVTGVSYSYLDVRFFGKATMTGSMDRSEKKFQIKNILTFFRCKFSTPFLADISVRVLCQTFVKTKDTPTEFIQVSEEIITQGNL